MAWMTGRFIMKQGVQLEGPSLADQNSEFAGVVLVGSQGQKEEKPGGN